VATNGDKGSATPLSDPSTLVERREAEMAEAAAVLGLAGRHPLGHPDGEIEDTLQLRAQLVSLVRTLRPDVVVCPDPEAAIFGRDYVNHRDHRVVGWATLDAVAPAAALPLYFPEAGPPHQVGTVYLSGTLHPDVWVDISTTVEQKVTAVLCHSSQVHSSQVLEEPDWPGEEGPDWLGEAVRQRAAEAGKQARVAYAEGFRLLNLRR
jgi:LmbE family N-acetylglucosaminyl deacetylase